MSARDGLPSVAETILRGEGEPVEPMAALWTWRCLVCGTSGLVSSEGEPVDERKYSLIYKQASRARKRGMRDHREVNPWCEEPALMYTAGLAVWAADPLNCAIPTIKCYEPVESLWRRIVDAVMERQALLGTVIQWASPDRIENGCIHVTLPDQQFTVDQIRSARNQAILVETIKRVWPEASGDVLLRVHWRAQ